MIARIARLNPESGLLEDCPFDATSDFPIETGRAYIVESYSNVGMVWPWSSACPELMHEPGPSLVGHPAPLGLTCFAWLDMQPRGTVASIQGYDAEAGRIDTCAISIEEVAGESPIGGVDFPIRAARGYWFHVVAPTEVVYPGCQ